MSELSVPFGDARLPARFWAKAVEVESGCWLWTAGVSVKGYARFNYDGRNCHAHRLAYLVLVGEHEAGLELDHLCRNRACVNPAHLEPVSHAVNVQRAVRPVATHCANGHEFTPENTRYGRQRICRQCGAEYQRRHRARRREEQNR